MAYQWIAMVVGVESEEFGLVVGDQGSGTGTHAWHISFEEPSGPKSSSFRAPRQNNIITALTVGKRSWSIWAFGARFLKCCSLRSYSPITTTNTQCLLIPSCYCTWINNQNAFHLLCGFYLHSHVERAKKVAGTEDMKGLFKSEKMKRSRLYYWYMYCKKEHDFIL